MNVYDFDKTIYDGDSTVDFYKYCIKRKPSLMRFMPNQAWQFMKYALKIQRKEDFKESIYAILVHINDVEAWVEDFWDKNQHKIKPFYKEHKKSDDLIISASPEFIILPICKRLNVEAMASRIDVKSGKHSDGINCHGAQKVVRFKEVYPQATVEEFYSDSYSDDPCAQLADKSFLVVGHRLLDWEANKK